MEKKARIEYLLSGQGRKKSLLAGGDGKELQAIEVEATPLIIELGYVSTEGNVLLQVGFSRGRYDNSYHKVLTDMKVQPHSYTSCGYCWVNDEQLILFDDLQTADSLIVWEQARVKRLAEAKEIAKPEIERLQAEHTAKEELKKEENRKNDEIQRLRNKEEAAKKDAAEKEKQDWITAYGSERLKRATKLGYNCQRLYVMERAAKEFPEFIVDFDNRTSWNTRNCPSAEILSEVEKLIENGFSAEVVWLTRPAYYGNEPEPDDFDEFKPLEAIVIYPYLGKYRLVG